MRFFLLTLAWALSLQALAQNNFPDLGRAFTNENVPRVDIFINTDSLSQIFKPGNEESDHEYPATFIFNSDGKIDTVTNIGFRLRGNTSRYSAKKSFKVAFNSFDSGKKFYGLEKMNLNGEHNDPSIMRSIISFGLFRDFGVVASRANYVRLFINEDYYGLYANIEHIDEEFVLLRYGNNDGNLYKCLYPADLNYIGNDPDLYKLTQGERRVYELKTNEEKDDYSDLANLINIINNASDSDFKSKLEEIFNIDVFLKYLAVEIFTGHWDGYSYNKNNFYLYKNTSTGKFEFIPYDMDNTFGIDWFGVNWESRNIYNWYHDSESRPLTKRVLDNQEFRQRFSFYMQQLIKYAAGYNYFSNKIDGLKSMTSNFAKEDYFRTLDYGWDFTEYNYSFTMALGNHVKSGLKPYIQNRNISITNQLENFDIAPIINSGKIEFNQADGYKASAIITNDDGQVHATCYYRINNGQWIELLLDNSGVANPNFDYCNSLSAIFNPDNSAMNIDYYFTAEDQSGVITRYPDSENLTFNTIGRSEIQIKINEFMAGNDKTIADEYGEYDDWIEIYNAGNATINLSNIYLSDNPEKPGKWSLPSIDFKQNEFLLIWADGTPDQGEYHADFKLSKDGEALGIYELVDDIYYLIDLIEFGPQTDDISYGRKIDGTGEFQFLYQATPGSTNMITGIDNIIYPKIKINLYPNPANNRLNISTENNNYKIKKIQIFNIYGQIIPCNSNFNDNTTIIDLTGFKNGIYLINIDYIDIYTNKKLMTKEKFVKN